MPRPRKEENKGYPTGWRIINGHFYFNVPKGLQKYWHGRQLFKLGETYEEAMECYLRHAASSEAQKDLPHDLLIDEKTIRKSAVAVPLAGVYILLKDQKIQYVGRSNTVLARIDAHVGMGVIEFDSYHYIPADGLQQEQLEKVLIGKFAPPFNTRGAPKI